MLHYNDVEEPDLKHKLLHAQKSILYTLLSIAEKNCVT